MPRAYIALGGNLGDVRRTLNDAIAELCTRIDARLLARSSDYRTPPWGDLDQPPFVNACMCIETDITPQILLAQMHAVERMFGRDRALERRWGPRTLDLDLIAYDDIKIDTPDLVLPHPRLFERAFVLLPLAEIAPQLVVDGRSVIEAARTIDASGIEKLPGDAAMRGADPRNIVSYIMRAATNPLRILITGFGPFPGAKINPSAVLARALARLRRFKRDDLIIQNHILNVRWETIEQELREQIARHQPDILLMFGVATRTPWLRVETRAHDRRTLLWPDMSGARPAPRKDGPSRGTSCTAGSFPARLVVAARSSGMDARLSHNAGRYLCNEAFWQALNHPRAQSGNMLASFIHIPLVQIQRGNRRGPDMTHEMLRRACTAILIRLMIEHRARRARAFVNRPL